MIRKELGQSLIDENTDRRLDARVKIEIPVQVEFELAGGVNEAAALASQLSNKGVTIFANRSLPLNSEILIRIPLPSSSLPIQPSAKVVWTASMNGSTAHGIKFVHIPKFHQPPLNHFISEKLRSRTHMNERRLQTKIISELIEFKSRSGKRIVGFHDHLLSTDSLSPFLMIPAPYTETKTNSLPIAYYLAINGFNVIRFDTTNHIGESEGEVLDYSLPNLKEDILSALDYIQVRSPKAKVAIVASSMAARAAFKVVREDSRPEALISLVGVVNMQYTLRRVQNVDLFETYAKGKSWGITNVLGFDVKLDRLLGECVRESFDDLGTTKKDVSKALCPIVFLIGEKDPWVDVGETAQVLEVLPDGKREIHKIAAMHKLKENPSEAKRAFKIIVSAASRYLNHQSLPLQKVIEPRAREIGTQGRVEKERARHLSNFSKEEEKDFWGDYLRRFHYIYSIADYRSLLDTVYEELGPIKSGDHFLDAGCGNGNFGLWLMMRISEEIKKGGGKKKLAFNYVGGDIVNEALAHARRLHSNAQISIKKELSLSRNLMIPHYHAMDMNQVLPFLDNSFEKICSNLVISYLTNPVLGLRELIRVLKPGGKLVLTTLKKDADVSQIYRNFVEHATSEVEVVEARSLLSNAGKILVKETEGYFRFFSEKELQTLLNQAYPDCIASYRRCFSDQAIALTVSK
ncbi:hypothetical protein BVX98_05130 [bacterium F11]|nr:hypothetical protein BVX98_05130 [bacterium F11]